MRKPSLDELMSKKRKTKSRPQGKVRRKDAHRTTASELAAPRAMARELFVRRFVSALLRLNMNASGAFRELRPDVSPKTSKVAACELLQCADVQTEFRRQLAGIQAHADLNEQWVLAQYRAMAHANVFDYVSVDANGQPTEFRLSRDELTTEQQLAIRRLKFDSKTGKLTDLELIDRKSAVDSIAKALRMFSDPEEESMANIAKEIVERMQAASKRIPRVFDGETGEEIEQSDSFRA